MVNVKNHFSLGLNYSTKYFQEISHVGDYEHGRLHEHCGRKNQGLWIQKKDFDADGRQGDGQKAA